MTESIAGFFKWTTTNGKTYCSKYDVSGSTLLKDTAAYYEFSEIVKWPLGSLEFGLDLDELARRYPLPENWREIIENKRRIKA